MRSASNVHELCVLTLRLSELGEGSTTALEKADDDLITTYTREYCMRFSLSFFLSKHEIVEWEREREWIV